MGTSHDALAPYLWSCSISWCLAECYRKAEQHCNTALWACVAHEQLYFFKFS